MTTATRTDVEALTSTARAVPRAVLARERAVAYDTTSTAGEREDRGRAVAEGTSGATVGGREDRQVGCRDDVMLAGLLADVDRTLGRLHRADLELLDPADLGDVVRAATRATRRLEAFTTRTVAVLDRRRAYEADGYRSASAWLTGELQVDPRTAARTRRVARELDRCPTLAGAYADGDISGGHVAVATTATRQLDDGDDHDRLETTLVAEARVSDPRQLARQQRRRDLARRAATDPAATDRQAHAARAAGYIEHAHGGARFWQELTPGDYELHRTATRAYMTADPDDLPDDQRRSWTQRLYDASIELARRALVAGDTPTRTGSPVTGLVIVDLPTLGGHTGAPDPTSATHGTTADDPQPSGETSHRQGATVSDPATAGGGDPTLSGVALSGYGGPISSATVRRMLCDAQIARVVTDGASQVLDVGRTRRTATPAQHRALIALWHGCARCGAPPAYTEAHHIDWWDRDHGPTDLANLLPLCWACHSAVHHTPLTIETSEDGSVVFVARNGTRQHRAPP